VHNVLKLARPRDINVLVTILVIYVHAISFLVETNHKNKSCHDCADGQEWFEPEDYNV